MTESTGNKGGRRRGPGATHNWIPQQIINRSSLVSIEDRRQGFGFATRIGVFLLEDGVTFWKKTLDSGSLLKMSSQPKALLAGPTVEGVDRLRTEFVLQRGRSLR